MDADKQSNHKEAQTRQIMVRLEQEINELKHKEDSLRDMIQNKQIDNKVSTPIMTFQSSKFSSYQPVLQDPAMQSKYNYLLSELENAKAEILRLKEAQIVGKTEMFEKRPVQRELKKVKAIEVVPPTIYSIDEIKETVQKDLAEVKNK